jgi:NAD-dependent histone deacetylase SIR2
MTVAEVLEHLHDPLRRRCGFDGRVIFEPMADKLFDSIPEDVRKQSSKILFEWTGQGKAAELVAMRRMVALLREYIIQNVDGASKTHEFIGALHRARRLCHCYSQNVDGLEARVGLATFTGTVDVLNPKKAEGRPEGFQVLQLHGGLETLWCSFCRRIRPWDEEVGTALLKGHALFCPHCPERSRTGRKIRRGELRLGMVLYGESYRFEDLVEQTIKWDMQQKPKMLLVFGTSLQVPGALRFVKDVGGRIRRDGGMVVAVNRSEPTRRVEKVVDVYVQMECDSFYDAVWCPELEAAASQESEPRKTIDPLQSVEQDDEALLMLTMTG